MSRLRIGIIGCGTIGGYIARYFNKTLKDIELIALADIDKEKALVLAKSFATPPQIMSNLELIDQVDLVIEAACKEIVPELIRYVISKQKDMIVLSVGGLIGEPNLLQTIMDNKSHIHIPSGAIAGLDAAKAASIGKIKKVILTTTKPPKGLVGAPYIKKNSIDLFSIKKSVIIFEGTAKDAVTAFPKNINVAAALSIATLGPDKTIVKIVVNPKATTNSHKITIKGDFGEITTKTVNMPCPYNPKSSYLAVLSCIAMLEDIVGSLKVAS